MDSAPVFVVFRSLRLVSMTVDLCGFVDRNTRARILERLNYELQNRGQRRRFRSINAIQAILEKDGFESFADIRQWSNGINLGGITCYLPLSRSTKTTPFSEHILHMERKLGVK